MLWSPRPLYLENDWGEFLDTTAKIPIPDDPYLAGAVAGPAATNGTNYLLTWKNATPSCVTTSED